MQSRRTLVCLAAASAALAAAAAARAAPSASSYPRRQVSFLINDGVFHSIRDPQAFHPAQPLSPALLDRMLAAIPGTRPVVLGTGRLTVAGVDAAFVEALGLRGVAADVARGLRAAGLQPGAAAGLEVVARNLGLRHNYPAALDARERLPGDTAIRMDGAYATWKVLREQGWEQSYVHDKLAGLWIPPVPAAVHDVLQRAVSEIGSPYVWAGGSLEDGGFDCSGLVLYALGGDESWLGGRTTHDWARAHRKDRLGPDDLEAGDVLLFGRRGRRSRPGQVDHTALYLGNGWFIDSASQGVSLDRLDTGYYAKRFAFALRPPRST
ncbi:MAG: peptidoglycan DL-endopeptidase CwlO [Gaiellales bacterium]|nr:peptidoglycan DL-endopeptidase CwlO [Gaiellales bacterium]